MFKRSLLSLSLLLVVATVVESSENTQPPVGTTGTTGAVEKQKSDSQQSDSTVIPAAGPTAEETLKKEITESPVISTAGPNAEKPAEVAKTTSQETLKKEVEAGTNESVKLEGATDSQDPKFIKQTPPTTPDQESKKDVGVQSSGSKGLEEVLNDFLPNPTKSVASDVSGASNSTNSDGQKSASVVEGGKSNDASKESGQENKNLNSNGTPVAVKKSYYVRAQDGVSNAQNWLAVKVYGNTFDKIYRIDALKDRNGVKAAIVLTAGAAVVYACYLAWKKYYAPSQEETDEELRSFSKAAYGK